MGSKIDKVLEITFTLVGYVGGVIVGGLLGGAGALWAVDKFNKETDKAGARINELCKK